MTRDFSPFLWVTLTPLDFFGGRGNWKEVVVLKAKAGRELRNRDPMPAWRSGCGDIFERHRQQIEEDILPENRDNLSKEA